jgi:hypothetical protein
MEAMGTGLIIVLVVLALAELALVIWALVDIARRPRTSALPRWGWVLVVIFFNLIGPLAYLLVGRRDETVVDEWSARQTVAAPATGAPAAAIPGEREVGAGGASPGGSPSADEAEVASQVPEAPAAPDPPPAEPSRTERAIDALYGTETSEK